MGGFQGEGRKLGRGDLLVSKYATGHYPITSSLVYYMLYNLEACDFHFVLGFWFRVGGF